ncbi:MAG: hypothetical protein IPH84_11015 [Bacteroidales bacterium]|nr:hypothetical protein [Bacteroidales bacterium]
MAKTPTEDDWEVVYEDAWKQFRITCINENTYIAIGEMGLILKTTNGGTTWDSIPSGTTVKIRDIEFVNETNGFIAGDHDYNKIPMSSLEPHGGNTLD